MNVLEALAVGHVIHQHKRICSPIVSHRDRTKPACGFVFVYSMYFVLYLCVHLCVCVRAFVFVHLCECEFVSVSASVSVC